MRLMDKNDFLDLFYVASTGQDKRFIKAVEMVVEDTPTIDAVPVVRCKDCKWYTEDRNASYNGHYCTKMIEFVQPSDFCSYGERKDGAE